MREVESAHAAAGPHGKALRELDAGVLFHVEQLPQGSFLGVVGAGGITRRRSDAAIFFLDEIVGGKVFCFAVTPFFAGAFVQIFRESFGEAVGQRLGHDGVVVVVVGFELIDDFF